MSARPDNSRAGTVTVSKADLLALLDGNLEAANIALSIHPNIDRIEENGGAEADDDTEQMAWHLYYTLHAAARIRSAIAAQPATADSVRKVIDDMRSTNAPTVPVAVVEGWIARLMNATDYWHAAIAKAVQP